STLGTDPTRRANGSMRFLVSVRRWPRLWSPALLIRGRSDQEETSRPGSGSCRSNTRAAARTSSAVSASKAIDTCVVCSPPARWPSVELQNLRLEHPQLGAERDEAGARNFRQ